MRLMMVGIVALLLVASVGCKSDEEIALEVSKEWTASSFDAIDGITAFFLGYIPGVTQAISETLKQELRDRVTWTYSVPRCSESRECRLTATADATIDINLAIIRETVEIVAPILLVIDAEDGAVVDWEVDFDSASVCCLPEIDDVKRGVERAIDSAGDVDTDEVIEKVGEQIGNAQEGLRDLLNR